VILGGDNMSVARADKREGAGTTPAYLRIGGGMVLRIERGIAKLFC
jgi:hypothetical protein